MSWGIWFSLTACLVVGFLLGHNSGWISHRDTMRDRGFTVPEDLGDDL